MTSVKRRGRVNHSRKMFHLRLIEEVCPWFYSPGHWNQGPWILRITTRLLGDIWFLLENLLKLQIKKRFTERNATQTRIHYMLWPLSYGISSSVKSADRYRILMTGDLKRNCSSLLKSRQSKVVNLKMSKEAVGHFLKKASCGWWTSLQNCTGILQHKFITLLENLAFKSLEVVAYFYKHVDIDASTTSNLSNLSERVWLGSNFSITLLSEVQ